MAKKESKDEQIGFHKGSLATLAKEREEFMRILQIVEQLCKCTLKNLKILALIYRNKLKKWLRNLKARNQLKTFSKKEK